MLNERGPTKSPADPRRTTVSSWQSQSSPAPALQRHTPQTTTGGCRNQVPILYSTAQLVVNKPLPSQTRKPLDLLWSTREQYLMLRDVASQDIPAANLMLALPDILANPMIWIARLDPVNMLTARFHDKAPTRNYTHTAGQRSLSFPVEEKLSPPDAT